MHIQTQHNTTQQNKPLNRTQHNTKNKIEQWSSTQTDSYQLKIRNCFYFKNINLNDIGRILMRFKTKQLISSGAKDEISKIKKCEEQHSKIQHRTAQEKTTQRCAAQRNTTSQSKP